MKPAGFSPKARWDRRIPERANFDPKQVEPSRYKGRGSLPSKNNNTHSSPGLPTTCSFIQRNPVLREKSENFCEGLNEKIQVLALFRGIKIYPRMFIWNNKKYKIKGITYNWQERQGKETISYFSVNTGVNLYQISFNNTSYAWRLDKLIE